MTRREILIGTRGSQLAFWQAKFVAENLRKNFSGSVKLVKIKTTGDKILDSPLAKIGGKGLFVKEIEEALLKGEIDLAVHSMKDVPTELPARLTIGAMLERENPGDALISKGDVRLSDLPESSVIATSSLRRKAQLLNFRPDLKVVDVRGNLDTRVRKMEEGLFDAILLAVAGLVRMGWADKITERISTDIVLPAVGQGSIGIEIRKEDEEMAELVSSLNHKETYVSLTAERAFLKRLEGGCQVPIGALGLVKDGRFMLSGVVASLDGKRLIRDSVFGDSSQAEIMGINLAERLIENGAGEILKGIRESG